MMRRPRRRSANDGRRTFLRQLSTDQRDGVARQRERRTAGRHADAIREEAAPPNDRPISITWEAAVAKYVGTFEASSPPQSDQLAVSSGTVRLNVRRTGSPAPGNRRSGQRRSEPPGIRGRDARTSRNAGPGCPVGAPDAEIGLERGGRGHIAVNSITAGYLAETFFGRVPGPAGPALGDPERRGSRNPPRRRDCEPRRALPCEIGEIEHAYVQSFQTRFGRTSPGATEEPEVASAASLPSAPGSPTSTAN